MLLDDDGGVSPFGWAVACAGRKPTQLRDELATMIQWATQTWTGYFPAERGYQTEVEVQTPGDDDQHVRLSVVRGGFRASVSIEKTAKTQTTALERMPDCRVRMSGRAQSEVLAHAHQLGERLVQRFRAVGVGVGLLLFGVLCWLSIGVYDPIFVLGGLLMVVALLLTIMAGGTLGACIGESLARLTRSRARRSVHRDTHLQDDLRRWKALSRQMAAQRAAFVGHHRRQPFRSEPSALPEAKAKPLAG